MKNIRILITDDHPMMREALQTALLVEPDLQVVGEAANGLEALQLAAELLPDIILMDLLMADMDGLQAIARLQESYPSIHILVVTSLEDEEKIIAAIHAGALGYFPKTAPRSYLIEAIRKVADGIPYLPSGIALKLFQGIRKIQPPQGNNSPTSEPLTARQEEILTLLGEGRSNQEIAHALHLTVATVRSHVHQIIQRLDLSSRAQLIAYANQRKPA